MWRFFGAAVIAGTISLLSTLALGDPPPNAGPNPGPNAGPNAGPNVGPNTSPNAVPETMRATPLPHAQPLPTPELLGPVWQSGDLGVSHGGTGASDVTEDGPSHPARSAPAAALPDLTTPH